MLKSFLYDFNAKMVLGKPMQCNTGILIFNSPNIQSPNYCQRCSIVFNVLLKNSVIMDHRTTVSGDKVIPWQKGANKTSPNYCSR